MTDHRTPAEQTLADALLDLADAIREHGTDNEPDTHYRATCPADGCVLLDGHDGDHPADHRTGPVNWRAAIVAAALVVACLAFVMLLGAGLLSRDDPEQGGRGIIVFGLLLLVSVAVAAGVWVGA